MKKSSSPWILCCSVFVMLTALSSNAPAASVALDNNFNPPSFAYPEPATRALLLPDGKFVEYFNVQTLTDQQGSSAIFRFFPDGSFDPSFSFTRDFPTVGAAAALPDGRLIVAAFQKCVASLSPLKSSSRPMLILASSRRGDLAYSIRSLAERFGATRKQIAT